jgi:hypothetical protein
MHSLATLAFLFIEPTAESDAPIGYLYAKRYAVGTFGPGDFDKTILTRGSMTWQEFQHELDRLHLELEEIRREAHLRFADATAKRALLRALASDRPTVTRLPADNHQ